MGIYSVINELLSKERWNGEFPGIVEELFIDEFTLNTDRRINYREPMSTGLEYGHLDTLAMVRIGGETTNGWLIWIKDCIYAKA